MTAVQPPLFLPGWEQEPCGDADEQPRRVDFGALLDKACADYEAQRRRWVDGIPDTEQPEEGPTVEPLSQFGRSASRPDNWLRARIRAVAHTGSYL